MLHITYERLISFYNECARGNNGDGNKLVLVALKQNGFCELSADGCESGSFYCYWCCYANLCSFSQILYILGSVIFEIHHDFS